MKLWYMRDNHLFRKLPLDVEQAIAVLRDEFDKGYSGGMLCSDGGRPPTSPMVIDKDAHARAEFAEFEPRARRWLTAELAYRSPGDLEFESWTAAGVGGNESGNGIADPDSYTPEQRVDLLVKAAALIAAEIDRQKRAHGVAGTLNEQEKELGACSISRATIGDRTHDRRTEEGNRSPGEKEQRGGQAGRCDATSAGGAELGARGGDAAQHEVSEGGGTGDGAARGVTGPKPQEEKRK